MRNILLVDGNPLLWRSAYANFGKRGDGSIALGCLQYFYEIVEKFKPSDLVVCWDKGLSRWRSEICPEYKANRLQRRDDKIDREMVQEQARYVREYFSAIGVRQIVVKNVEADDVLGWLSDHYLGRIRDVDDWRIIVATGDRDLWQLVREDGKVLVWDSQKQLLVTEETVREEFDVPPTQVAELKALMGDTSDNLPGVKGIGKKNGAKLLNQMGSLGGILDLDQNVLKELGTRVATSRILDAEDIIGETYRLVKLPTLREAIHCLTDEEFSQLKEQITEPTQKNAFKLQIMTERIGKGWGYLERLLPKPTPDLEVIVKQMEQYQTPDPGWSDLQEVDQAILECAQCPLRGDTGEFGPTIPSGHREAEIMLVGRNPGLQELQKGSPFQPSAPAGARLDKFLENVGLTRGECWITNACKCYSEKNRPPTAPEVTACSRFLRAEIDILKPKLIIAFGNEAMSLVTQYRSRVTKHCGEILDGSTSPIGYIASKVAISVHPSAACRPGSGETNMTYAETMVKVLLDKVTE
jgi:uracil-DNA glycosylase family 4